MSDDKEIGDFFKIAEKELNDVALKYGFTIKLIDDVHGTWYFYPQVEVENGKHD